MGPYQVLPLQGSVNLGEMTINGYSAFPRLQHFWSHSIKLFRVISRTLVEGVLHLCKDAGVVFNSSSWLGQRTLVEGILPFCKDAVDVFYSPSRLGHRTVVGEVLLQCRDAASVFYRPCPPHWLGHRRFESVSIFILHKWPFWLFNVLFLTF